MARRKPAGSERLGTVFRLTLAHALVVPHTFLANRDGAFPNTGLFCDGAGNSTALR